MRSLIEQEVERAEAALEQAKEQKNQTIKQIVRHAEFSGRWGSWQPRS